MGKVTITNVRGGIIVIVDTLEEAIIQRALGIGAYTMEENVILTEWLLNYWGREK